MLYKGGRPIAPPRRHARGSLPGRGLCNRRGSLYAESDAEVTCKTCRRLLLMFAPSRPCKAKGAVGFSVGEGHHCHACATRKA